MVAEELRRPSSGWASSGQRCDEAGSSDKSLQFGSDETLFVSGFHQSVSDKVESQKRVTVRSYNHTETQPCDQPRRLEKLNPL